MTKSKCPIEEFLQKNSIKKCMFEKECNSDYKKTCKFNRKLANGFKIKIKGIDNE